MTVSLGDAHYSIPLLILPIRRPKIMFCLKLKYPSV